MHTYIHEHTHTRRQGFVEDYTFSIEDGEEGEEVEEVRDIDSESGEHITYATFLEGTRSQRGQNSIKVNGPGRLFSRRL